MQLFSSTWFYHCLWYFILYSLLGWCVEVVFCSVNTGKFVNRGFLNGPLCPIYGFGATIIVTTLQPLQNNLLLLYLASVVLCSMLELVAGFLLKKLFHTSWWDYSDAPFNIGGYICLKFSLLWGIACIIVVKGVHPLVEQLVEIIPTLAGIIILIVLYLYLFVDLALTVAAIMKWNQDLAEMTRLAQSLRKPSDAIAEKLGNAAIDVADKVEEWELASRKEALEEKLSATRSQLAEAVDSGKERLNAAAAAGKDKLASSLNTSSLQERWEQLAAKSSFTRKRLLKAFPRMKSSRYDEALKTTRDKDAKQAKPEDGKNDFVDSEK